MAQSRIVFLVILLLGIKHVFAAQIHKLLDHQYQNTKYPFSSLLKRLEGLFMLIDAVIQVLIFSAYSLHYMQCWWQDLEEIKLCTWPA